MNCIMNIKVKLIKYTYIIFLFFSITFNTGCEKKEYSINMPSISFFPQPEGGSRANLIDGAEDIYHFIVWGNYDGNVVFDGTRVSKEDSKWVYAPTKYWNTNATQYEFYAYTPHTGTATITNNQLSVSGIDLKNNPVDLVMAYTRITNKNFRKVVELNFKHALAIVKFSFKLKEGFSYFNTYRVTSIKWKNVHTQGQFAINRNDSITSHPLGSLGETITITTFKGDKISTSSAMVSDNLLVIPQSTTMAQLTFSLEINEKTEIINKTIPVVWEPGAQYMYNVIIDPYEVTVETTPWEVIDIDNDLIIN